MTRRGLAAVTLTMPIACTVPMSAARSLRANPWFDKTWKPSDFERRK